MNKCPFVGPLIRLFWTSSDVRPGFQSQGGFLACALSCLSAIAIFSLLDPKYRTLHVVHSKLFPLSRAKWRFHIWWPQRVSAKMMFLSLYFLYFRGWSKQAFIRNSILQNWVWIWSRNVTLSLLHKSGLLQTSGAHFDQFETTKIWINNNTYHVISNLHAFSSNEPTLVVQDSWSGFWLNREWQTWRAMDTITMPTSCLIVVRKSVFKREFKQGLLILPYVDHSKTFAFKITLTSWIRKMRQI